jgi:hypothetical protein
MRKLNRKFLILAAIVPVGCLAGLLFGLFVGWQLLPVEYVNTQIGDLGPSEKEDYVLMVAAEYAVDNDANKALSRLDELDVANPDQFVAYLAEQYVQEGRGADDPDTVNLVRLAEVMGVSSEAMVAYVATATATPTPTPLPTDTPTATATPTATLTPAPTSTLQSTPTETPEPTRPPKPTPTPGPPTETPTPTPPPVDFVVKEARMLTIQENGGCRGRHEVSISVLDVNGQPLLGAVVTDLPEFHNFRVISGQKNEPFFDWGVKLAEVDLYKSSTKMLVTEYPEGRPVTSDVSPTMSTNDWEIGIPLLVEKGYCSDEGQCQRDWNSGVAGVGANALCWGHYAWWLVFQATHPL